MNTYFKRGLTWIALSIFMTVYWIIGLMIASAIFPNSLPEPPSDSSATNIMLLVICLLNTGTLLYFIHNSHVRGWKLVLYIFLISFGLQYFLSQIETLWFNDALKMSHDLIWTVVLGGAISIFLFAITATWMTGGFKKVQNSHAGFTNEKSALIKWISFHAIFTWPIIYLMAGYFIAWQFSDVRQYYTGSDEMQSFITINIENITSGLYFFQIFRGLIWISIAFLVLFSVEGTTLKKGMILGLLFSIISSSQLLLPNPIMPDVVRIPHLIETSTSNFLWGFILVWTIDKYIVFKKSQE